MNYGLLCEQAESLVSGVPHLTADLANLSALVFRSLDRINWAGFYILEGKTLVLGPFQGKPACIEIPEGRGVCGTALRENRTVLVPDVHAFPGHIACDADSRSEIVIPIRKDLRPVAVLDIDSPEKGRFDEQDRIGLEKLAGVIEKALHALL
ncbi:MAG: GAF domain-containing protein [Clostridia bacterium]|nr:GAF domain-containing protein [Clostridia bacterium]